jgi:hypothetical protein
MPKKVESRFIGVPLASDEEERTVFDLNMEALEATPTVRMMVESTEEKKDK